MIYGLLLILLGILAAPSLLLSKRPDAKEALNKITPYQGWIGIVFCILGIWGIISAIMNTTLLTIAPIYWVICLLVGIVEASLGFILGYSLIQHYALSKNAEASEKGAELLAKLRPMQVRLGLISIVLGVLDIISSIYYHL